jgi:type IV pilus assembly protein PilW
VQNGTDFTPVAVTPETAGDRIDVISATQVASGANVLLKTATTGAATAELRSLLPVSVGQAVLLAPSTTGAPCVVRSVTAVQDSTDLTPQRLSFGASGDNSRFNQASFTTNPTFTANDYPDIGRVALLGDLRWTRYRLQGTDLRLERPLVTGDPVVLVRNVVAFRAQYGVAAASGTALESWESATGDFATVGTANVARVRALQVGLVTRSPQAEKPAAGDNTNCTNQPVTASMPSLFGTAATADVTNWRCYRYRTAIVVVPLRNLVVGMTP